MKRFIPFLLILFMTTIAGADVKIIRVPNGGIEPQAAVDAKGTIHLIYYKGPEDKGDLYYVTSKDGEKFSKPVQVNSKDGSALSIGSVRGAQMAIGRDGRVHVAWMGSSIATPKAPGDSTPMLYTRTTDDGKRFEPQKNVIAAQPGMDGGGSIAADGAGHVYIAWHAPISPKAGEQGRLVWLTKSSDDGKTFAKEFPVAADQHLGTCACCSLHIAVAPGGGVVGLYRKADEAVHRGTMLFMTDRDVTKSVLNEELAPMKLGVCLMSNFDLLSTKDTLLAAYETSGALYLQRINPVDGKSFSTTFAGKGKYPAMAVNSAGEILIARGVGTAWKKGGTLAWHVFDSLGQPLENQSGEAPNLPAWSYPAAVAKADGSFLIFY